MTQQAGKLSEGIEEIRGLLAFKPARCVRNRSGWEWLQQEQALVPKGGQCSLCVTEVLTEPTAVGGAMVCPLGALVLALITEGGEENQDTHREPGKKNAKKKRRRVSHPTEMCANTIGGRIKSNRKVIAWLSYRRDSWEW